MSILDKITGAAFRARYRDLEARCLALYEENAELREKVAMDADPMRATRIATLEAALERMIKLVAKQYSGEDEQAVIRSARAVLNDKG